MEGGFEDFKVALTQKAFGLPGHQGDGIAVEGDFAHDVACARVEGVVFPEGKDAAGLEVGVDLADALGSFRWGDVVEYAVAEGQVVGAVLGDAGIGYEMGREVFGELAAGDFQGGLGGIATDQNFWVEGGAEVGGRAAGAAAKIEDAPNAAAVSVEALVEPFHPVGGEEILALAGDGNPFGQGLLVVFGVFVELGFGLHGGGLFPGDGQDAEKEAGEHALNAEGGEGCAGDDDAHGMGVVQAAEAGGFPSKDGPRQQGKADGQDHGANDQTAFEREEIDDGF